MPGSRYFFIGSITGLVAALSACSDGATPNAAQGGMSGAGSAGAPVSTGAGSPSGGSAGAAGAGGSGGAAGTPSGGSAGADGGPIVPQECAPSPATSVGISWDAANEQPAAFYATDEARALADNVLYYQNADHGWPKNIDMSTRTAAKAASTIDNRATTTQIEFLARVYSATSCAQYQQGILGGVEFLLAAQYDNGGWPQTYPNPEGYRKHITFNDDAMIHVLQVLHAIASGTAPYGFVDAELRGTSQAAVQKGIDCILACQIQMAGDQRGWCAQHDEVTLKPALARSYELPSVSGSEGARIARFLMTIDPPTPEIRAAIKGAMAWFEAVKITGIRVEETVDTAQPTGEDRVVVSDATAPPIWARFYELGTNKPIFSSRCEVPECEADPFYMRRYSLAEIENERRVGYAWYGNWPAAAISEYQAWLKKYPE
jgi:PelA/Pel-15E family pectate lyase